MKYNIFKILLAVLILSSCSEDFLVEDNDKSRYTPNGFYVDLASAQQALNAAYSGLNQWGSGYTWSIGIMHFVHGEELYQTGNAAGFNDWGSISNFDIQASTGSVADVWNGYYGNLLIVNNALEVIPAAFEASEEPNFTQAVLDDMMGQAYFLRAFYHYCLFQYFPRNKIITRLAVPQTDADFAKAPSTEEETFAIIEKDLQDAQTLLANSLNTTSGREAGRITRGSAAALLGKLYINSGMYTEAAAEFRKILPGVGDAAYGSYSLVDYRDNFTIAGENNNESVFEIQFSNQNGQAGWSNNDLHWIFQNFTLNRTTVPTIWWNFAVPNYKLDEFETWTEGTETVYDYRAYETFWGVPNGAEFNHQGTVLDWQAQGWDVETVAGITGVYGIRKYAFDNTNDWPRSGDYSWSDVNLRIIRLADVMLLYAECMANLNPSNVDPNSNTSAVYWVQQVRDRANQPMNDQAHLYSARAGVNGQLPDAADLLASEGWTTLELVQHERYVEGFCEGWSKEDMRRWQRGADYISGKPGWEGHQTLILPVPQSEIDNNPNMQ